jgi:hypothetical protein
VRFLGDSYSFINFNNNDSLVEEIRDLESELSGKTGHEVILLAYTKRNENSVME